MGDQKKAFQLLTEIQDIWDRLGKEDEERMSLLKNMRNECLQVYHEMHNKTLARLTEEQAKQVRLKEEYVTLYTALNGEPPVTLPSDITGTLKKKNDIMKEKIDILNADKDNRVHDFSEVFSQIVQIRKDIAMGTSAEYETIEYEPPDLCNNKLEDMRHHLRELTKLKNKKHEELHDVQAHS